MRCLEFRNAILGVCSLVQHAEPKVRYGYACPARDEMDRGNGPGTARRRETVRGAGRRAPRESGAELAAPGRPEATVHDRRPICRKTRAGLDALVSGRHRVIAR